MKTPGGGFERCYNARLAVDMECYLIYQRMLFISAGFGAHSTGKTTWAAMSCTL